MVEETVALMGGFEVEKGGGGMWDVNTPSSDAKLSVQSAIIFLDMT